MNTSFPRGPSTLGTLERDAPSLNSYERLQLAVILHELGLQNRVQSGGVNRHASIKYGEFKPELVFRALTASSLQNRFSMGMIRGDKGLLSCGSNE